MIRSLLAVLLVGSLAVAAVPRASAAPTTVPAAVNDSGGRPANDRRVVATSVDGMPIVARHYGALDAPVQLVVVGQMHGSEPGGQAVVRELAKREPPSGVGLWLIITMNPDGDRRDDHGHGGFDGAGDQHRFRSIQRVDRRRRDGGQPCDLQQ